MSLVCLWSPRWETGGAPLAELATALLSAAPRVAVEARGVLWADARGLPAPALAHTLLRCLHEENVGAVAGARAGVSVVPVAAEAAARSGGAPVTEVAPGYERAFLAPLPLKLLGAEARLLGMLNGVGIRTCGPLAALERAAVEVRFGTPGGALWRLARADDARRLFAPVPRECPRASLDFVDYTVGDAARLLFTANALLGNVCATLAARGECAGSLILAITLADGGTHRQTLRVARPTADRAAWLRRLQTALEAISLGGPATGVALEVEEVHAASATQGDLFDRGFASARAVEDALSRLIDRYGPLIVEPERNAHPLAERRTRWVEASPGAVVQRTAPTEAAAVPAPTVSRPCLTLQLLPEPRPIEVRTAPRRDHLLPVRYYDGCRWRALATAAGPDRVSGGQWEASYAREYFRCITDEGRLVWVFRDAREGSWYMQGSWE